jgi:hypothetical protein
VAVVAAVAAALAGPLAYSVTTASAAESGAIPSAGPAVAGSFGGPGGFGAGRAGRFGGAGNPFAGGAGAPAGGQFPGGQVPGGRFPGGQVPGGGFPGAGAGGFPGGRTGAGRAGGGRGFGGGIGGLLGSTAPSAAVRSLLEQDASTYRWVAAITGAEQASGYQLATGDPVMAIGGFNGTDPTPTLAAFERDVAAGDIHWYIAGGGFGGRSGSGDAGQIATWVAAHYSARTVGGVTLYDLSPTA